MTPIWYWLFPALVFCLALYVAYRNWGSWEGWEFEFWAAYSLGLLITGLVCFVSIIPADMLSRFIALHSEQTWKVCWRAKMVGLRSSDGIKGSISGGIFLMSGQIGSEQVYHYYTSDKSGAFIPNKWIAGDTTRVLEENRTDGEVVQWDMHFNNEWVYWFAEPWGLAMDFHIPKGSLKQSFSLQ